MTSPPWAPTIWLNANGNWTWAFYLAGYVEEWGSGTGTLDIARRLVYRAKIDDGRTGILNGGFETPVVASAGFQLFSTGATFAGWTVVGQIGNVAPVAALLPKTESASQRALAARLLI